MKTRTVTVLTLILAAALGLASCYGLPQLSAPQPALQPTTEAVATAPAPQESVAAPQESVAAPQESTATPQEGATMANPASQNCIAQGGRLEIEARGDGGQFGVCYLEDNLQCEEWALLRGECPASGVKVTGYTTPAARYCAITGGEYAVTGKGGQDDEQGVCTLKDGSQCEALSYYNGECLAVPDGSVPSQTPAPVSAALQPPIAEVCNGMAQALMEAASRAAAPPAYIEVTQSEEPVPLTDPTTMASGTACRATITGTGAQFAGPDAIVQEITAVLTGGGWEEDMQLASGGPTGMGSGYRSGDLVCIAAAIWHPDASANCPADKPISACTVTPEQQLYTITIDCAQAAAQPPLQGVAPAPGLKSNPAAQNCKALGGKSKIETGPGGGQYGVCFFGNNYQCEEWALMRGECPAGGVKVTGYNTLAARYCAITGGKYAITGNGGQDDEHGACSLPDGRQCEVWSYYYFGECDAVETADEPIGMPNPASQNCTALGGQLKIEERGDSGQIGVCYFEDNRQCEEWALMRGECPAGGVKVTGYNTEAARFCAITGGTYTATGTTPDGMEAGDCALPNGEVCYVWHYYHGYCGASSAP